MVQLVFHLLRMTAVANKHQAALDFLTSFGKGGFLLAYIWTQFAISYAFFGFAGGDTSGEITTALLVVGILGMPLLALTLIHRLRVIRANNPDAAILTEMKTFLPALIRDQKCKDSDETEPL